MQDIFSCIFKKIKMQPIVAGCTGVHKTVQQDKFYPLSSKFLSSKKDSTKPKLGTVINFRKLFLNRLLFSCEKRGNFPQSRYHRLQKTAVLIHKDNYQSFPVLGKSRDIQREHMLFDNVALQIGYVKVFLGVFQRRLCVCKAVEPFSLGTFICMPVVQKQVMEQPRPRPCTLVQREKSAKLVVII